MLSEIAAPGTGSRLALRRQTDYIPGHSRTSEMTFGGSLKGPPRGKDFPWPFGHHEQGRIAILTAMSHLEPIIAPKVESAGYRLVRLRLIGGKRKTLQIMAERPDGQMDVEDCAKLSRALSEFLDAEDPIEGDYVLEVSSPGIDRPLTRITDFARWSGHEAKIELTVPDASGRKRFKGQILGLDGNDVVIDAGGTRVKFPFSGIADAKLVLTDKLIEEDLKAKRTPKQ